MDKIIPDVNKNGLGPLVKKAREAKGWSLQESADIMQLGPSGKASLHSIESGANSNPTLKTLVKLVVAFGIRPEAIFAAAVSEVA